MMQQRLCRLGVALSLLAWLAACTTVQQSPAPPNPSPVTSISPVLPPDNARQPGLLAGETPGEFERGRASWYGPRFHGRRTANGERFDMHAITAAHRTLPFGTMVRVRSLVNGREVDVRINDRGPYSHGRVIDLSYAAAAELGMLRLGVKNVVLLVPKSRPPVAGAQSPSSKEPASVVSRVAATEGALNLR